jgi:hypothetical protein
VCVCVLTSSCAYLIVCLYECFGDHSWTITVCCSSVAPPTDCAYSAHSHCGGRSRPQTSYPPPCHCVVVCVCSHSRNDCVGPWLAEAHSQTPTHPSHFACVRCVHCVGTRPQRQRKWACVCCVCELLEMRTPLV